MAGKTKAGRFGMDKMPDMAMDKIMVGQGVGEQPIEEDKPAAGGVDTSGTPVANDIARFTDVDTIEGRSYAELKDDLDLEIGTDVLAQQTIGIANDNLLEVDHVSPADNDYAKFTVNGLEGRSYSEVRTDINVADGADVTSSNAPQAHKTTHQDGGGDEVSVAGLSGLLNDDQHVLDAEVTAVAVAKTLFDAQTILTAVSDNTPVALAVAASRILGRKSTGNIAAMTAAEVRTILGIESGSTADQTGVEIVTLLEALVGAAQLSHTKISDVGTGDHHSNATDHAQSHTLTSHSSKPHSELSDAPEGAHHTKFTTTEHSSIGNGAPHHTKYTDPEAKAAAVRSGAITNAETKAPTHDAVYDVKVTADAAQTASEVDADIATHKALASDHHTKYTDANARSAAVSNTVYGAGWNGVTTIAPSKNAVYDKIETLGANGATKAFLINPTLASTRTYVEGDFSTAYVVDPSDIAYIIFRVPYDFSSIVTAILVGETLGSRDPEMLINGASDYGAVGEAYNTHSESAALTTGGVTTAGNIDTFDISGILSSLAANDYVGIKLTDNATVNKTCNLLIYGVYFRYS